MTEKRDVDQYILPGEIRQFDDLQVFEFRGKDARGSDFGLRLTPAQVIPLMKEPVQTVDADRVFMYAGSDPAKINEMDTEIEITIGTEPETYTIDSAAMTYIPKGTPYGQSLVKNSENTTWILTLTLPPKYDPPQSADSKNNS